MIARAVATSFAASLLTLASVRSCTRPAENVTTAKAPPPMSPPPELAQPTPPPPPPTAEVRKEDLAPWASDSPERIVIDTLFSAAKDLDAGRPEEALRKMEGATAAQALLPGTWAELQGRVLLQNKRLDAALEAWGTAPEGSGVRAQVLPKAAAALVDAGRADEALAWLEKDLTQPPSPEGTLLRARALLKGGGSADRAAGVTLLREAWARGGRGVTEHAERLLGELVGKGIAAELRPVDQVARASAFAARVDYDEVITLLGGPGFDFAALSAPANCDGPFELGRAYNKRRRYTESLDWLQQATERCPGTETGVRAGYLHAQSLARLGRVEDSVKAFVEQCERRPDHSYADDCLIHAAGLELGEARPERAQALLERVLGEFPQGDMAEEARWNLAWTALQGGAPAEAVPYLDELASGPVGGPSRDRVLQARYWGAQARRLQGDSAAAIGGWESLAEEAPLHWYGVLAMSRLRAADSARAEQAERRVTQRLATMRVAATEPEFWTPDRVFWEDGNVQEAIGLLRSGHGREAIAQLRHLLGTRPEERFPTETLLFVAHLADLAGDWSMMQDLGRRALARRWVGLDPASRPLLSHAWPLAFADEIAEGARGQPWSPMLLQALAREESTFNPGIVSWAGAVGLCQLMPETAAGTAKKHRLGKVSRSQLEDPALNSKLGGAYLGDVLERWNGHIPLGVASYNAGPGAVKRWIDERGSMELDAWVEAIPFDQTRHYVIRVVSSFQAYHALWEDGPPFVTFPTGPVADAVAGSVDDPSLP